MAGKKSSEVLDLSVIDLSNGTSVGKVASLVVDAAKRQVIGIEVTSKSLLKSKTCFIPINKLRHIGSDAITVNDTVSLVEEGVAPELKKPEQANLLRKKVISEEGVLAGSVEDFSFDENGNLKDLYLSGKRKADFLKGNTLLPASAILNIGQDYVIVAGDYATQLQEKEPVAFKQIKDKGKEISSSLETKAIAFALNKTVKHDIYKPAGELIIAGGETVTLETIELARESGRLPQLLVATGTGELLDLLDKPKEKLDSGSKKLLEYWHKIKNKSTTEDNEERDSSFEDSPETSSTEKEIRDFFLQLQDLGKLTLEKVGEASTDKMRQFLLGKKSLEKIQTPEENILVGKDQVIDSDIIRQVEEAGLLLQLFANVMRGEVQSHLKTYKNFLEETFEKKDES